MRTRQKKHKCCFRTGKVPLATGLPLTPRSSLVCRMLAPFSSPAVSFSDCAFQHFSSRCDIFVQEGLALTQTLHVMICLPCPKELRVVGGESNTYQSPRVPPGGQTNHMHSLNLLMNHICF